MPTEKSTEHRERIIEIARRPLPPEPLQDKRGHKLIGNRERVLLPPLQATDGQGEDALAVVKLFNPTGRYTLLVTEFDDDDTLYGYCFSALGRDCDEWGYTSLRELARIRLEKFGRIPGIERDLDWEPTTVGTVLRGEV